MRKVLWIAGAIVALLVVIVLLVSVFFDANRYRPQIESKLSESLGRQVTIGNLKLSIFSGGIGADDISIADDPAFGKTPFIQAKSLNVGVQLMPLIFSHQLNIESLVLNAPTVRLLQSPAGKWNFSTLGNSTKATTSSSGPAPDIQVGKLEINKGEIEVGQPGAKQQAYTDVTLKATNVSMTRAFPFKFSAAAPAGGKIAVDGTAGPVDQTDSSHTPVKANLTVTNLDLNATGFISSDSGIDGVLDYKGTITSDGKSVVSQGQATAHKLRLVKTGSSASQPVQVDYVSSYDLARNTGTVKDTSVHIGKSALNLSGTYASKGATTELDMNLVANSINPQDLEALLPAVGVTLPAGSSLQGGNLAANFNSRGASDKLVTTGVVKLSDTKLTGFSLSKGLSMAAMLAGVNPTADTEIQNFSSNLRVAPEGIRADNLNLVIPELGAITGAGTVGADGALNFKLLAKLNTAAGALGVISKAVGMNSGGTKDLPISVKGTTQKPIFMPDMGSAVAGSLLPTSGNKAGGGAATQVGNILGGLLGGKKKK